MLFGNDAETIDVTEEEFNKLLHISSCQIMSYLMDNYDLYAKFCCQSPLRFLAHVDGGAICTTNLPVSDLEEGEDIVSIRTLGIGYGMVFCRWENDTYNKIDPPDSLKPILKILDDGKYTCYPSWNYVFGDSYKTRRVTDDQIKRLVELHDAMTKMRDL